MKISRDRYFKNFSKKRLSPIHQNLHFSSSLRPLLTLIVPALFFGCAEAEFPESDPDRQSREETVLDFSGSSIKSGSRTLDIFVFENDRLQRLDAYQRIDNFDGNISKISSTGGEKIFFFCADGHRSRYGWADISSYSSLGKIFIELSDEKSEKPVMTGECRISAGSENGTVLMMPLSSEISVESICCDFSGTAYAGSSLRNVKVYLTNVNASCPILFSDTVRPIRIINVGQLTPSDLKDFSNPDIIFRNISDEVGNKALYPDVRMRCYQNTSVSDNPGAPPTRLVIEGEIEGRTYYWPITVDAGETSEYAGVKRGYRYIYNIRIRRKGVTDPDIPFNPGSIDINMKVKPWMEKEEYSVLF